MRAVVAPVDWTEADGERLRLFLETGTGKKLRQGMVAAIAEQNEIAVNLGTPASCGRAVGFRALWALWESFSTFACGPADRPETATSETDGLLAGLAHLSP